MKKIFGVMALAACLTTLVLLQTSTTFKTSIPGSTALTDRGEGKGGDEASGEAEEQDLKPSDFFKDWYYPYDHWPVEMQRAAIEQIKKMPKDDHIMMREKNGRMIPMSSQPWVQRGPFGILANNDDPPLAYSGRVLSLDHHPSRGLCIGSSSGGLWKEFFGGFIPITDDLPSLAIGAVAYNPSGPDTIFVGTGEYPDWSGAGGYRSIDGGITWTKMSMSPQPVIFSTLLVPPWGTRYVFAATTEGLYRSTDGGDTWDLVKDGFHSYSDIVTSVSGSYMLAGHREEGILRSTDHGATWKLISDGLPVNSSSIGRIKIAISESDEARAYAQIGNPNQDSVLGVYKTTNSGISWTAITPSPSALSGGITNYYKQQDFNSTIAVSPTDPNIVWTAGVYLLRTTDGGSSWHDRGATGIKPHPVHGDVEILKYTHDGSKLYVGSHGGVFYTTDEGATWSSEINMHLPITQFYNTDIERHGGRTRTGGTQDNGIVATTTDEPDSWRLYAGGDGIDGVVNQYRPTMTYGINNGLAKNKPKRSRTDNSLATVTNVTGANVSNDDVQKFWDTYLAVDDPGFSPERAGDVFTNAWLYVYWSEDSGTTWQQANANMFAGVVKRFTVGYSGSVVYAPTASEDHPLYRLDRIGFGDNPWVPKEISSGGLPAKKLVKRVHPCVSLGGISPTGAVAIMNGVGDNQKIYWSLNRGDTWTNITGDLPDVPVNDVVVDPHNNNIMWCGTARGAFRTSDGGTTWHRWNAGMPEAVMIMDMKYVFDPGGDYIFAGTYGRSTFTRPVLGTDPVFVSLKDLLDWGDRTAGVPALDSTLVVNTGDATLEVTSVLPDDPNIEVSPLRATVAPGDSITWHFTLHPPRLYAGTFQASITFTHNGDDSISILPVRAYIGDGTAFRSFVPESLTVKKESKRKTASTAWCFRFDNTENQRSGANALVVQFKNPVLDVSASPFTSAENTDGKGKTWKFSGGAVPNGSSATVCGHTARTRSQEILHWWWMANLGVWDNDQESVEEGMLGSPHDRLFPESSSHGFMMPNAANLRKEIFSQYPVSSRAPMVIGVADPLARDKKVAYVAFGREGDLYNSLITRAGVQHSGPARCFDVFDGGREMSGKLRKLTPDQKNDKLFAELVALKLNIYGSELGMLPPGFGELRYRDSTSRFNGLLVRDLDSVADNFMTYCGTLMNAESLHTVVRRINEAFSGPVDTVSFAQKLVLTGVRPVAEVPYLVRDPALLPRRVEPLAAGANPGEDVAQQFELAQNYPNPFNPVTTISFQLPVQSYVSLKIYNTLGQEVRVLLDREVLESGSQEIEFQAGHLASGVYFYRIVAEPSSGEDGYAAEPFVSTRKMLLLK